MLNEIDGIPIIQHVSFNSLGVKILFPFEPYDVQKGFMSNVIKTLHNKENAILESPTGTGKTLSLLCSSLAWLNDERGGIKKSNIYYTSRTHMQLNQAANEMKRTAYARNPAVVIGSRSKMCLNKDVKAEHGDHLINRACRNAIARNACEYFSNYEQKLEVMNMDTVNDIEDLLKFGTAHKCCPYYASKKIAEVKASVVFMPYNYLLDTSMKKSIQLKLENSVIIFDEGHNLEGALKDSASAEFSLTCLNIIQESCLKLPQKLNEAINNEKHGLSRSGYEPQKKRVTVRDEFSSKQNGKQDKEPKVNPIEELVEKLTNDKLQQVNMCAEELRKQIDSNLKLDESCSIDKVFQIMNDSGVKYSTSDMISTTLESMASFWSIAGVMNPVHVSRYVSAITNLSQFISLLFPGNCLSVTRQQENEKKLRLYYGAHLKGIYEESAVLRQGKHKDSEFCLWCLHPGIGLKRVLDSSCLTGPRSIIITSGTLAPTHSLPKEMDIEFKIIQEFKHVIKDNQLKMMIIGTSPKGYSLNSNYNNIYEQVSNRTIFKEKYAIELGETLIPLMKVLPFGTLIFFPSYGLLNKVKKAWDKSNITQRMNGVCQIYVEDTQQEKFLSKITAYKKIIDNKTVANTRAAFLGVCRGKLSEGTNLEGNHCRTVILIGLPYPSMQDPKIVLTQKFHEDRGKTEAERIAGKRTEQGKIWYSQQMNRALNQTIGRVIRSKTDYGMVIFCDPRFRQTKYSLSRWAVDFCPRAETPWDKIDSEVKEFYKLHGVAITETASESCGAFEITFRTKTIPSNNNTLHNGNTSNNNNTAHNNNILYDRYLEEEWSSYTESVNYSQAGSQGSNNALDNRLNGSQPLEQAPPRSAAERQEAIVSEYRVDRDTFIRAKNRARPSEDPEPAKKQKTTVDIFNSLVESTYKSKASDNPTIGQQVNGTVRQIEKQPFACQSKGRTNQGSKDQPSDIQQSNSVAVTQPQPQSHLFCLTNNVSSNPASQTKSNNSQMTTATNGTQNYSILDQIMDKNRPGHYKCEICKHMAANPNRTNCPCARVGCLRCIRGLRNRPCGKCGILIEEKKFKQLWFQSASGKEKFPLARQ